MANFQVAESRKEGQTDGRFFPSQICQTDWRRVPAWEDKRESPRAAPRVAAAARKPPRCSSAGGNRGGDKSTPARCEPSSRATSNSRGSPPRTRRRARRSSTTRRLRPPRAPPWRRPSRRFASAWSSARARRGSRTSPCTRWRWSDPARWKGLLARKRRDPRRGARILPRRRRRRGRPRRASTFSSSVDDSDSDSDGEDAAVRKRDAELARCLLGSGGSDASLAVSDFAIVEAPVDSDHGATVRLRRRVGGAIRGRSAPGASRALERGLAWMARGARDDRVQTSKDLIRGACEMHAAIGGGEPSHPRARSTRTNPKARTRRCTWITRSSPTTARDAPRRTWSTSRLCTGSTRR